MLPIATASTTFGYAQQVAFISATVSLISMSVKDERQYMVAKNKLKHEVHLIGQPTVKLLFSSDIFTILHYLLVFDRVFVGCHSKKGVAKDFAALEFFKGFPQYRPSSSS